jgi:hypothetical protein
VRVWWQSKGCVTCRHNPKPMIGLLTDSFQLAAPDPRQGPVCGNDTIVKGRLCTPLELDVYYRVRCMVQGVGQ